MSIHLKICIVDYEVGNTYSVFHALEYLGYSKVKITDKENVISEAEALILPGVGAFDEAAKNLRKRNLDKILNEQEIGSASCRERV